MKRYRIHFVYIVIIALLAVVSRMKSNELEEKVVALTQVAEEQKRIAEEHKALAEEQAARAVMEEAKALVATRRAEAEALLAQEALKKCQGR